MPFPNLPKNENVFLAFLDTRSNSFSTSLKSALACTFISKDSELKDPTLYQFFLIFLFFFVPLVV
ncbi:hypothetical protein LEP1GSC059_0065 [Leptospira phage vB_LnoZ_CZ214-LE1]|uniref:Uncharacterized protein n=1 Tax=Leptospira noguchii serovar Autumnalis str. ZUN142 TaxID=1085540 RepID=M6U4Y7_9LEPT|nr:hypothetical protein LEP1GSC059_0065 [Leptospira phage vB_LnoZ_CZ214-LE1]EMO39530.1 hypothetical protein LEP1GSC186_3262 [Leptospira noguchii serovar Autumnalis str. ZUN142]